MHISLRFYFSYFLQLFSCLPTQYPQGKGRGLLSKNGQAWIRGGRGIKTGKNGRISCMDSHLSQLWIETTGT